MNVSILIAAVAIGLMVFARLFMGVLIVGGLLALQGVPLFPMFFALGTRGAREHFRLTCPQCGAAKPKGANFLFTEARCRKCNARWK